MRGSSLPKFSSRRRLTMALRAEAAKAFKASWRL